MRVRVFALLSVLASLGLPGFAETVLEGRFGLGDARAYSGHHFEIKGHQIRLDGVRCPDVDTVAGRDAKALMNQFLRTNIKCRVLPAEGGWRGSCTANGQDVAEALLSTGLCRVHGDGPSLEAVLRPGDF